VSPRVSVDAPEVAMLRLDDELCEPPQAGTFGQQIDRDSRHQHLSVS
jgi:hypothetical protein